MAVRWVYNAGKGPADAIAATAAGNAALQTVLTRFALQNKKPANNYATYRLGASSTGQLVNSATTPDGYPLGVSAPAQNYWFSSAEYRNWRPTFDAVGHWQEFTSFSDIAGEVFIGATGIAVGGGIVSTLAGGGAAAGATAGAADTTSAAAETTTLAATVPTEAAGGGLTLGGVASGAAAAVKAASGALGLANTAKSVLGSLSAHDPSAAAVSSGSPSAKASNSTLLPIVLVGAAAIVALLLLRR